MGPRAAHRVDRPEASQRRLQALLDDASSFGRSWIHPLYLFHLQGVGELRRPLSVQAAVENDARWGALRYLRGAQVWGDTS
jgi:hypothetical protein